MDKWFTAALCFYGSLPLFVIAAFAVWSAICARHSDDD